MTLVVDASVAAKWIFNESDSDLARALRLDARRQGFELVAPEILPAEVGNVIGKRVVRGEIDPAEARSVFREFRDLCPALVRLSGLWRERWRCLFDSVIRSTTGYTWRWRGRETAYW